MGTKGYERGFAPTFQPERLDEPLHWRKPRRIFVVSMGELFGDWVPHAWIERVIAMTQKAPQHTFQFLTKHPERLADFNPWPDNCWVGVTATDQEMVNRALICLRHVKASICYLSCEPLLGDVSVGRLSAVKWVIIGALTGPIKRHNALRESLYRRVAYRCALRNIPVFVKNNVPWTGKRPQEFPRQGGE